MSVTSLLTAPFIKWSAAVVVSAGLVVTPAVVLNQTKQTAAQAAETIEKKQAAAEAKVKLAADEAKEDAADAKAKAGSKADKATEKALEEASAGTSAAKSGVSSAAAAARNAASGVSVPGGSVPGTSVPAIPNLGITVPAAPSGIPGLPEYSSGSYKVVVPGAASVSKRLCLSGTVDECETVTTPALSPITLTVSYSGNTSIPAPTFTPGLCPGGVVVTVGGLETGATLKASVTSGTTTATLSLSVAEMGVTQSVSLCDA